jgi:hypothetical protein
MRSRPPASSTWGRGKTLATEYDLLNCVRVRHAQEDNGGCGCDVAWAPRGSGACLDKRSSLFGGPVPDRNVMTCVEQAAGHRHSCPPFVTLARHRAVVGVYHKWRRIWQIHPRFQWLA